MGPATRRQRHRLLANTSGSTSTPKGVILEHKHVLANAAQIGRAWRCNAESVAVTWLPHFHDNGLVKGVIQPLFDTFHSVLMSPVTLVERPFRWLEAITRYRATHSGGPNFAYALCAERISMREREELDLRSWKFAYNGAEPVRKKTLDDFAATFAPCGFRATSLYPAYGLAEATLLVSLKRPDAAVSFQSIAASVFSEHDLR